MEANTQTQSAQEARRQAKEARREVNRLEHRKRQEAALTRAHARTISADGGQVVGSGGKRGGRGKLVKWERSVLRALLAGTPVAQAARDHNVSANTVSRLASRPHARAFMARERERIDAHRILLAATLPFLYLAEQCAAQQTPDKHAGKRIRRAISLPDGGPDAPGGGGE